MEYAYVKQLIVNGDGKYHVVKLGADSAQALSIKKDIYMADAWEEATEAEYQAQMGESSTEVAPSEPVTEPVVNEQA